MEKKNSQTHMITNSKLVLQISEKKNVNQILDIISQKLVDEGFATSKKIVLNGFKEREKQSTTGLADGIAIPHVSSKAITESKIVIVKLKQEINWKSLDGIPTDFVIAIAVPANGRSEHFDLLTNISGKLANPEFVKKFKKESNKNIVSILNNIKASKSEKKQKVNTKSIKVVGVTSCITGVAHTFMAAKALEDEGHKRGWDIKIEKQGQMTKGTLLQKDIDAADYVIIATAQQITNQERFNGKKVYITEVAEPITKAAKVFDDMIKKSQKQVIKSSNSSKVTSTGEENNNMQKQSFMSHMMAGISYMIPYIAMAGITLGLTTAFGFSVIIKQIDVYAIIDGIPYFGTIQQSIFGPKNDIANAFNTLAGQGFTLYIPILAMMIANSISGRKAMAPAAILAMILNIGINTTNYVTIDGFTLVSDAVLDGGNIITGAPVTEMQFAPFWNWKEMGFQFNQTPALGFLGAITSGYMIGYGIKYFTKLTDKVEIQVFQTILPLMIIPILFTTIPFIFMAFIGYLPLYWISVGLNSLVNLLVNNNLLWIAGGFMGAMICFDLGGPVNKVAMTIGVLLMSTHPEVNGICALAVSVPPAVLFFSMIGHRFTPLKMDNNDVSAAMTASVMGFFGITEGSIPFAAKEPKKWMPSFMFAGVVGGILISFTGVTDNVAMWGGPIIWIAGGFGSILGQTAGTPDFIIAAQTSNWDKTLLYFLPLAAAGISGFAMASLLEFIYSKKDNKVKVKV